MNTEKFDLNLLLVFEAVLKDRNVTAAGARLGMSQPTMSHALKRLRAMCGDPLFVRTTHGMQPTPYALQLAAPIEQSLETIRSSLDRGLRFDAATSTRTFNLLMTDIGESMFLPRLMAHLRTAAPGVNIVATQIVRDQYRDALQSGSVDLALGQMPNLLSGFYQQRLFEDPYVCMVRADHPRIGARIGMKQYLSEVHQRVALPGSVESVVEQVLAKQGLQRRVALRIPHYLAAPAIIAATDLVVTVPRLLSQALGRGYELRTLAPPLSLPRIVVRQFWHERNHYDAGNRWLRSAIATLFHPEAGS